MFDVTVMLVVLTTALSGIAAGMSLDVSSFRSPTRPDSWVQRTSAKPGPKTQSV